MKMNILNQNHRFFFQVRKEGIDHVKVSEVIGKAYLILTDFSRPRRADYTFSWHEIASKDGIAFLLLYCHARLYRYNYFFLNLFIYFIVIVWRNK
jgi:arginyl-tRNA synthetase